LDNLIRVGAVNYLNTKPLICDLEELAGGIELILDVPSRLADGLADGRLDVALIPAIEYFRAGSYTIVPGLSIASRGPVLSVTLFSKVPWPGIRRVALDEGSRTSAALVQILLRKRHGVHPEVVPLPLDRTAEEADADAVLLIGDRAMRRLLAGVRPRLRPRAGVARLDWVAVRLRLLGGARGGGPSARWRPPCTRPGGAAAAASARSPTRRRRVWGWTPVSAAAIFRALFTLTWARPSTGRPARVLSAGLRAGTGPPGGEA